MGQLQEVGVDTDDIRECISHLAPSEVEGGGVSERSKWLMYQQTMMRFGHCNWTSIDDGLGCGL